MNDNIIIDSTKQIISTITDSLSYKEPIQLVDTLVYHYTPFSSQYVEPDRTVATVTDLFGSLAKISSETNIEPILRRSIDLTYYPLYQYLFVLATLLLTALVVYKFSEHVGRLFKLTFSFPHLYRQLESANNAIDTMAHYVSSIMFFLLPMIYLSFYHYHHTSILFRQKVVPQIWIAIFLVVSLYLYKIILRYLFYRFFHNRYFYRRLFIAERICISSYTLILLPLSLLASVPNFFQNSLIKVQFLMVILFGIHYLLTIFKLFIEEKVSYVQLILYFCTVKAVIISLIIYFGILWL